MLKGHVAIISGGLGDIGRAIALELARNSAAVGVGDLRPETNARDFLQELRRIGSPRCRYDVADVSDAVAVQRWLASVEQDLGVADLIIPNAAIVTMADIRDVTPQQWNRELRINLDGAFHLAQAGALRLLHHRKPGRIVFIGSWAAHAPHTHIPAYCAAKAGVRMLSKCMALDLGPHDILVNEVAPGYVDAGLSGQIFDKEPELRARAQRRVPVRRLIEPEDVAREVLHLCDPANRHATGSTLLMDGGLSLGASLGGDENDE